MCRTWSSLQTFLSHLAGAWALTVFLPTEMVAIQPLANSGSSLADHKQILGIYWQICRQAQSAHAFLRMEQESEYTQPTCD